MNDEQLVARMREAGAQLRRRPGDPDRLYGWLMQEAADRLEDLTTEPGRSSV